MSNIDKRIVDGFGEEWSVFIQEKLTDEQALDMFDKYFSLFLTERVYRTMLEVLIWGVAVDELPMDDESMDFAYSLGVLHHVPDTASGIKSCVEKLKPGATFLFPLTVKCHFI